MLAHTHVPDMGQTQDPDASLKAAYRPLRVPVLMIAAHGPEYPIVFANAAFLRLSGCSGDEVLGQSWRPIVGEHAEPEALAALEASLKAGEGHDAEFLCRRSDGASLWGSLSVSPVRNEAGRVRLFIVTMTDIGAMKQRERLLEEQLEQKKVLLQEVEHRVKNSLQMTASLVLLKARRLKSPEARKVLQEVAERVGALAAVHRLLHGSSDSGRFNIRDLAAELVGELILALPEGQVELSLDVQPIAVPASKAAALALLLNEAIGNAVKHAFPDGRQGRLTITIGRMESDLAMTVEDDGVGLDHAPPPEGSFGKTLMTMLAHQLKGRLTWHDMEPGTRAQVVLPIGVEETRFE